MSYYRNPKLLAACRELPCQRCGIEDGTVVAAHSNQLRHGKGRGVKAHDVFVAALCHRCHYEIDAGKLSREEKRDDWTLAHESTLIALFKRGLVVVA